jgi:hypothetical protein
MRSRNHFLLLPLFLVLAQKSRSQSPASDGFRSIPASFNAWQAKAVHEKLFVHTDQTFYLAGEILWFKLYAVDGSTHKPLGISKIAYVEVLDSNSRPVLQAKVALERAAGNGSFFCRSASPPAIINCGRTPTG